jgi:hypothetical protein
MTRSKVSWCFDGVRKWLVYGAGVIVAVALIGLSPAGLAAAPAPQDRGANLGPGCAPDRAAIAHHVGGVKVDAPRAADAPVPCVTKTGYRVGEESIVVTNLGTVLLRPIRDVEAPAATKLGLVRSTDQGGSWEAPNAPSNDTNMWADRTTGRVFWTSRGRTDISDDDGKTWYSGGRTLNFDHIQVFGGPPIESMKYQMKDYPNVVYVCVGHSPLKCQKSLDGGMTFGPELDIPYPQTPEVMAIQGSAHDCSAFGLQGVVDKEGTVIVPYGPCNRPYVAISHDEGSNWQLVPVANTNEIGYGYPSLGMDEGQNLYAAWVGASDRLPYMSISRDHGMHWSTPLMIAAPGVNEAAVPYLVSGARGQVAVTYYGSKNAPRPFPATCFPVPSPRVFPTAPPSPPAAVTPSCPGYEDEKWDTFVTESWNALDQQPLFWSATLNDPAQSTWNGCSPSEIGVIRWDDNTPFNSGPGHFRGCYPRLVLDYYGATMAPDGTVVVGFAQMCPFGKPAPGNNPNCPAMSDPGGLWGLVGRLVPRGEHATAQQKAAGNLGASNAP